MISEELTRRLATLRQSAQDFMQMLSLIDGNFDGKANEIKALEMRRDKLREECEETQRKANEILQKATDDASVIQKEAARLLDEAKTASLSARDQAETAKREMAEAQALKVQALQRQKEADQNWKMAEDRKQRMLQAVQ